MPGLSRKDDELRRQQLLAVLAPAVARAVATEPADEDASEDEAVPLYVAQAVARLFSQDMPAKYSFGEFGS
jgi:hypothetical protein